MVGDNNAHPLACECFMRFDADVKKLGGGSENLPLPRF